MNKLVKGAIAGAAGVALLLGGAGTFALWNDSEVVQTGSISTGTLDIAAPTASAWTDVSSDVAGAPVFPTSQRIVPGDTVRLTQTVPITGSGKNLRAKLNLAVASDAISSSLTTDQTVGGTTFKPVTVALGATAPTGSPLTITADGANGYTISGFNGTATTVTVTVTVAFNSLTPNQVGQNASVDLSKITYTLNQVRP
jgi:alternate signal-mediated exported protein